MAPKTEIDRVITAFIAAGVRPGWPTYQLCHHLDDQQFRLRDVNGDMLRAILPKLPDLLETAALGFELAPHWARVCHTYWDLDRRS